VTRLVVVVADDEGNGAVVAGAQPGDDGGQDAGELRVHQQQAFLVALGGHDLQQWHDFAAVGQPVGDQRQVGDLQQFFQAHSGQAQRLDDRPGPERLVLAAGQVDRLAGDQVFPP